MAKSTSSKKTKKAPIIVTNKKGNQVRLLRPNERGEKYAMELKQGIQLTNMGDPKVDKNGNVKKLSRGQRAYRAGFLQSRQDSANAYNYKNNKPAYEAQKQKKRQYWASRRKNKSSNFIMD